MGPITDFLLWLFQAQTLRHLILYLLSTLILYLIYLALYTIALRRHLIVKSTWLIINRLPILLGFILTFIILCLTLFIPPPQLISPQPPLFNPLIITDNQPLTLEFDRPIKPIIQAEISPPVKGTWQFLGGTYPFLKNRLVFYPHESFLLNTEYSLSLRQIQSASWIRVDQTQDLLFTFSTPSIPRVSQIDFSNNPASFPVDSPITLTLSHSYPLHSIEWLPQFEPQINYTIHEDTGLGKITILPTAALKHQTKYQFSLIALPLTYDYLQQSIIQRAQGEPVFQSSFTTINHTNIKSITPGVNPVLPQQSITLQFVEAMDRVSVEASIYLNPSTPLNYQWSNAKTLIIEPKVNWAFNSNYTLNLSRTAKSIAGGYLKEPITHQFTTIGPVKLIHSQPLPDSQNHPVDLGLSVTFDQPVDQTSAQNAFHLSPNLPGQFSWSNNTLTFTPATSLTHQTQYSVTLDAGIKSLYSQPSIETYSISFTTTPSVFKLKVPQYHQSRTFSCYAAAAQMALGYKGIQVSELGFADEIGWDQTPRNFTTNTWGNPNQGIVGTIDGSGSGGYGVHWGPVAQALSRHTQVEIKQNWQLTDLLMEISSGHPVVVWWVNGVWPAKDVSWNLPSGEKVYTVNGMHVEVVKGFVGTATNPQTIITNDPWRGERYYTPTTFNNLWRWFNNTGIIIK